MVRSVAGLNGASTSEAQAVDRRRATVGGVAVAIGACVVITWRILGSAAFASPDSWVYTALGRQIIHGHRFPDAFPLTTVKPLAVFIGALTTPFPPEHAFQILVGLAWSALFMGLFLVAHKRSGYTGAFVAVAALAASPGFSDGFFSGEIDVVTAALVILAIGSPRRIQVALLVLAGLLRPEAWIAAGFMAFLYFSGPLWRRISFGFAIAGLAPIIWLLFAAASEGIAFSGGLEGGGTTSRSPSAPISALYQTAKSIGVEGGVVVVCVSLVGFVAKTWRRRRIDESDWLVAGVLFAWPGTLAVLYFTGVPPSDRYSLPIVAVIALQFGEFADRLLSARGIQTPRAVASILAVVWIIVAALLIEPTSGDRAWASDYLRTRQSLPTIDSAFQCGAPLAVAGSSGRVVTPSGWSRRLDYFVLELAVVSGHPLSDFRLTSAKPRAGESVLAIYSAADIGSRRAPLELPLGRLFLSPKCGH